MNKKDFYNTIGLQIEDLNTLVDIQTEKCFDQNKLSSLLSEDLYKNLKRVIITGCGDSYSAAGAMLSAFKLHSGIKASAVPDPMEFCRFYTKEEVCCGFTEDQVLVIAVSASGGSERIVEIMEKANKLGVNSMLITNNPESAGAKAAKTVFHVETPAGCNSPGLRSYFASMVAIVAFGAYVGLKQGLISDERFDSIKKMIVDYVKICMKDYEKIDDQVFELAQTWKGLKKFEVIGDDVEGFSGQFVEEKFIECAGVYAAHADSEDWCHINFWLRDPHTIGTIIMVPEMAPNFDRMVTTITSAVGVGRPVMIVSDADADQFPEGACICRMPKPEELWMAPLMDFYPGSLMAGYVAALAGKLFFMNRYDFRTQTWNS